MGQAEPTTTAALLRRLALPAVFVAIVDTGSFRAAAGQLGLSPSAVSKRLSPSQEPPPLVPGSSPATSG